MDNIAIAEHLATHDAEIKSLGKRLETCEETTKSINALCQSIAKMDITLSNTNETVKELKENVNELKEKPTKRWDGAITAIIAAIASGLVGYVIAVIL